ncbi:MAG: sulfotransferase domain-containing protein [Cyclobacteriaceae bacterium]
MENLELPQFIIVGSMKCGTTSLAHYLDQHPEISMSLVKEPNFFTDENFDKGIDWYISRFPENSLIKGEASTSYTKYPVFSDVPERINEVLPDVKIIYLVKDPIDRIISHLKHNYLCGREERGIDSIFRDLNNNYVIPSMYHMQIRQYLKYFKRENIFVIPLERFEQKSNSYLKRLFGFLEVDPDFSSSEFARKMNTSASRPYKGKLYKILTEHSQIRALLKHNPMYLTDMVRYIFSRKQPEVQIDGSLKEKLTEKLQPDVEAFRAWLGDPLEEWRNFR